MSVTIGRASQVNALGARVQSCICRSSCRGRQCWHLTAGLVGHVFVEADRRLGLQVVVGGLRVRIRVLHGGGGKDAATLPSLRLGPVLQVQRPRRASCNGSFHHASGSQIQPWLECAKPYEIIVGLCFLCFLDRKLALARC